MRIAAFGLFTVLAAVTLNASTINFTFSGSGTGSIGATTFTNANFLVSISADTVNLANQSNLGDDFAYEGLSGTININGPGTASFTDPLFVFGANGPGGNLCDCLGFGNFPNGNLIAFFNAGQGISTYDLTSNFGPITAVNTNLNQFHDVATNHGTLTFITMSDATFTATTGTTSPVPEPTSAGLLGMLLVGLFALSRTQLIRR